MQKIRLKLSIIGIFSAIAIIFSLSNKSVSAFSSGPPPARTNAPGETNCTVCHTSFALNSGPGTLTLAGLPANYSPNQEVTLTVTLMQTSRARYGFEATVIDDTGKQAGTIIVTDNTRTQLISSTVGGNSRPYIEHTSAGVAPSGTDQGSWTFKWRAPETNVGRVTFYVAGNAANGNGANSGDFIYTINASTQPAAALPSVATVSAASFSGTALASEAIVAAFGSNLASGVQIANTVPLPTELGGTKVKVKDSAGVERDAPLFFVAPAQINYQIPPNTANGAATITVTRDNTAVGSGAAPIAGVAPGLFAANANGQGVPAAVALRFKADGTQTNEPVAQLNAQNMFVPLPIDLGPDAEQVFLVLFGTGVRGRSALSAVTCQIGGQNAEVLFAGSQGGFVGLDQLNVRVPRSLIGRGNVDLTLMVDGVAANTVTINIR